MTRFLLVAMISAVALAQEKKTEAEELFEKAWWNETASGALDKALEGYKKAADATGPAATRARSLYRAAIVEQRLGRTDAAVALLERLARDFAGETELLKEAKTRLQEWTAVDLRKSFGEWYRSYVFSPEFQARVVDLVLRMGTAQPTESGEAWNQLLTIGEASVPALQEALKSSNLQLRGKATQLLLRLGVVPPTEALIGYREWMSASEDWLTLYRADEATRRRVREEAKGDEPHVRAVRAVATSPEEMLSLVLAESDWPVQYALNLLYRESGEAMRKQVEGLIHEPAVPEHVVTYLQAALRKGPEDADVRRCLDWTRSLPTEHARGVAAAWAALKLTDKSEEDLDAVLALVPEPGEAIVSKSAIPVLQALDQRQSIAALRWTPTRVGALFDVLARIEATGTPDLGRRADPAAKAFGLLASILAKLPSQESGALAAADALLDRAGQLRRTGPNWPRLATLAMQDWEFRSQDASRRWFDLLSERAVARWPETSPTDKTAFLELVAATSNLRTRFLEYAGDGLRKEAVARDTDPQLQVALVPVVGRPRASELLASFDLSRAEDAQAAVEVLARLAQSLSHDERSIASMGEILIHGESKVRRRALLLMVTWRLEKNASLLPAAKEVVADEEPEVRLWAVNRLCDWDAFEASPYLVTALADPGDDIRARAAQGLARVGREDAVPALVKLLDDPSPAVREAALFALEQIRKIVEQKRAWQAGK